MFNCWRSLHSANLQVNGSHTSREVWWLWILPGWRSLGRTQWAASFDQQRWCEPEVTHVGGPVRESCETAATGPSVFLPTSDLGNLVFRGCSFLGPLGHQRDLGGRGRSGALHHLRRPLCLPLWPSFLPFLALTGADKTNPGSPGGRRLTDVRWQAGSEGRSLSPQGSRWDVEFFYGRAWTPESPQTDSHLCSIDHIFSRHSVIPSNLPKCFGLPYFYDPSSKKGSVESGSAWFISEEKGWRVSYLWYQEVGFPSYHPVSFALGF